MACPHVQSANLHPPRASQSVYREDCTQCFDSIDNSTGLDVCLSCLNGGCTAERGHARLHHQTSNHPLVLNIRRTRKKVNRDEPPQKISKLAIAAEREEDKYDTATSVFCYECQKDVDSSTTELAEVIDGVLKANTFATQAEVKAWEQEYTPCEHTLCLQQDPSRNVGSDELGHCSLCNLKENLWLCLQCGNLGCGRAQFGGVGGNGHGLQHTKETGHAVAVKLGSITPEGVADVYCYACDEERIDTELVQHLAHWGINIADRQKTEKSVTEMQLEQNLKWDFSTTTEDGKQMLPLFGPGLTGLKNLGNSCYMASILQCLFAMPQFEGRYYKPSSAAPNVEAPAEDLETQLRKIADGLLSGRYSKSESDFTSSSHDSEVHSQKGLVPAMFKHLIGKGHDEFSTMRQQDAFELLLHLLKLISRSSQSSSQQDPTDAFRFEMEQRLQCLSCKRVRYHTDEQDNISVPVPARRKSQTVNGAQADVKDEFESVSLKECLDIYTADEQVELTCPACSSKDGFVKRSMFKTLPSTLVINARRFELVNWVPTKLDIPVVVGDDNFDLGKYLSSGLQAGEEALPEEINAAPAFAPNEAALGQLEAMGFPRVRCEKALHATGNGDADAAMNWLFAHMEDADIDTPLDLSGPSTKAPSAVVSQESIDTLAAMGIGTPQARKALKETDGDVTRALDWVFSHPDDQGDFGDDAGASTHDGAAEKKTHGSNALPATYKLRSIVCHKGASIHAGHYVAFIRKWIAADGGKESWVLFNDEKVVKAEGDVEEMKKFAYVYFFERSEISS